TPNFARRNSETRPGGGGSAEKLIGTLNTTAQRVQTLWISFVSFGAYLVITVLGTTHSMLFLEEPVTLPVCNIKLPLTSFYTIAPGFFLIFHFYFLIQLVLLARTVSAFETALSLPGMKDSECESLRMRLDNSVFLQLIAGAEPERQGRNYVFIAPMAWITIIAFPMGLFLLILLQFLPYHHAEVTKLHRLLLTFDLLLIVVLWPTYRYGKGLWGWNLYLDTKDWRSIARTAASSGLRTLSAMLVVAFAWLLAVYPSESHYANALTRLPGTLAAH